MIALELPLLFHEMNMRFLWIRWTWNFAGSDWMILLNFPEQSLSSPRLTIQCSVFFTDLVIVLSWALNRRSSDSHGCIQDTRQSHDGCMHLDDNSTPHCASTNKICIDFLISFRQDGECLVTGDLFAKWIVMRWLYTHMNQLTRWNMDKEKDCRPLLHCTCIFNIIFLKVKC